VAELIQRTKESSTPLTHGVHEPGFGPEQALAEAIESHLARWPTVARDAGIQME